jgi:DNA-binding transcriptional MerR regulator
MFTEELQNLEFAIKEIKEMIPDCEEKNALFMATLQLSLKLKMANLA